MRLIVSQFLRTLRERDEFDRLLPDLLLAMGYVPLAKPQTGVRQFGVDLAAVGRSPVDGVEELLLFVIKQGDIGRRDWDNGVPTSVRPSLNEALDVYLTKLVAPEHISLRKTIVLSTTGDLKQDIETNWNSFKELNAARANFEFWGADRVSDLVERHMLDEHVFAADDRSDLRRALAVAGDPEYDFRDLNRLLLRQLGLKKDGTLVDATNDVRALRKAVRRVHLASQICARWARSDGDTRQAIWVSERTMLWTWHRLQLMDELDRAKLHDEIGPLWQSYSSAAAHYFETIQRHLYVRDGMAGYSNEGAEFAMVLFEHIGLLGSIGLACRLEPQSSEEGARVIEGNVNTVADGLCALIKNNPASASPRLDRHVVDITLALVFLVLANRQDTVKDWVAEMVKRLDYCLRTKSRFPVGTDSLEDLVELEVDRSDSQFVASLMRTSWCLATVAGWCAILDLDELYAALVRGSSDFYADVCAQLWHPTQSWPVRWYFGGSLDDGETEAPYVLLPTVSAMRSRMLDFLKQTDYDWVQGSLTRPVGLWAMDFIACRHHRVPVPASAWYQLADQARVEDAAPTMDEGPPTS